MSAALSAISTDSLRPPATDFLGPWATSADCAYTRDYNGFILAANLSFSRKFGRSPAQLRGMPVSDFLHPDDVGGFITGLSAPRAANEQRWFTAQGVRWFAWEETALQAADGALVGIRAVGRDMTRQRLAEEQFYRLSRAVEQSPVSIVITDVDGRAQYVNSKFTEMSGRTLEDFLDNSTQVLRDGHASESAYEEFWQTLRAGGEWRGELSTRRGDGSIVWESVKASCLRNPGGEITNFLCLREDVTERKKLEHELRQSHKMESLGTLAGGIAHDFNNLLAIINGYAEFCQQGTPTPAVLQKSLREIHRAAQRASGLVRQILTFSRKAEVRFAPVDLNQLVRDLVALLAETFPRTVSIALTLEERLPALLADQNQLQQIILNLCVNARDAMPAGGVITLHTFPQSGATLNLPGVDSTRDYACLQASDTGTGMTPEVRARIFEPFFTTKPGNQGTGLGLAVVYGIVVAHHGCIAVESTLGTGSTFSVYLPLAAETPVLLAAPARGEFPGGTESLLIVDDEVSLSALLTAALTGKGYQTSAAASGLEAIESISDSSRVYDAVLLDLNMPGATGIEVLKVIRLCRPQLPVLIISGHITPESRAEFQKLGQHDFLQKPYTLDEVGRRLRGLLDPAKNGSAGV
ncbi:MAG: PAS domain S-box protein [Undibacterium sp.]|nr:PAS domain S-box protein [Opitutaceae bacterium]